MSRLEGSGTGAITEVEESANFGPEASSTAVSVVIPAFNEGAHVGEQVRDVREAIESTGWTSEIILVDDGSTDGTATRAASEGARVFRRRENRGYGSALKLGVQHARYPWILIIDADGTYPVAEIPRLLAETQGRDMVVGSRTGSYVKIPIVRRPAKWLLGHLASYLAGKRLPDINSGLRIMRRSLIERYEHLLPDGFSFTTTITLASAVNLHPVKFIPIDYHPRLGRSKIRPRNAFDFALLIIRTIVFFNPLRVFIPVGGVLAVAGSLKLGYDITQQNLSESAVLAFLAALIIWSVGLLADQNARMALSAGRR